MFEDPKVLVKETVAELHGLSYKKLKDGFMQKLCVTLQDTEKLLASAGQDGYLRHPREVAALEDLLPKHLSLIHI